MNKPFSLFPTGISFTEAKQMGHSFLQGTGPIPREMSFPVPKGTAWHDLYDHIKYTVLPNFFWDTVCDLLLWIQRNFLPLHLLFSFFLRLFKNQSMHTPKKPQKTSKYIPQIRIICTLRFDEFIRCEFLSCPNTFAAFKW